VKASQANSRQELSQLLLDFIRPLGAGWFMCTYLRPGAAGYVIERSIGNAPEAFKLAYLDKGYDQHDPVFDTVVKAGGYGFWTDVLRRRKLTDKEKEVMAHAAEWGMHEGFSCRIMLDHGGIAAMMIAGSRLRRGRETVAAFRLVCEVFANEGLRMLTTAPLRRLDLPRTKLSRMQLQILSLRAAGLSNHEIAVRLNRAEKTIESHVTEILRRLEARNMIEAVLIAQRLTLIPR